MDCIVVGMKEAARLFALLLLLGTMSIGAGAQAATAPCGFTSATRALVHDTGTVGHGIVSSPRNAIRPHNLAWELPIGAATGIMIAELDRPAANRIQSTSLQNTAGKWSNIGLGIEIGAGALAWTGGCISHRSQLAEAGFTALTALGAAGLVDLGLKAAFNRQYPYGTHSTGEFWEGGRSFPSGHAATSFAFASVVAHRYAHNPWIKWGAYALATGVSLSRYPAKKHFPSDILVGATLGYVTGSYLANHGPE
jgi:membrane-associated phospholipid phosphatase